jgi:hypothetical protein
MKEKNPKKAVKYDLASLKKEYDGKKIDECVTLAKTFNSDMIERGEKLIGVLWYLEKTKRFREYDGYQKLSFGVFVDEVCNIPYNRYRQLAFAYNWYPVESREYGPQTIQTIRQAVGVAKVPKVLSEIKAKLTDVKVLEKKREVINNVIKKHTPPSKTVSQSVDTKSYWKGKYDDLWKKYKLLEKECDELRAQVERQKVPIESLMKIREIARVQEIRN